MSSQKQLDPVVHYAVTQSITELAWGSLIHAFKIPLGGHLLSLNQSLLLTLGVKHASSRKSGVSIASQISNTAALLKAFSPLGARLTPMLAISVQGFLFALGVLLLGTNIFGVVLGSVLLSIWGFAQPLLLAWFVFGNALWSAIEKLWIELAAFLSLPAGTGKWLLILCIGIKILLAAFVAAVAWVSGRRFENSYMDRVNRWSTSRLTTPSGRSKEWKNPWFLLALVMSIGFAALTHRERPSQILLYVMRVAACAWIAYWSFRLLPKALAKTGVFRDSRMAQAIARLEKLRGHTDGDLGGRVAPQRQADRASKPID